MIIEIIIRVFNKRYSLKLFNLLTNFIKSKKRKNKWMTRLIESRVYQEILNNRY